ncbi:amblin-like isoform X2 [Dermacentor variabilis]|uniref:amblin-like isoform X2 n=1 Tax=Dermacentor variabilis TaxID=34621 RepID=UPI003F5B160A
MILLRLLFFLICTVCVKALPPELQDTCHKRPHIGTCQPLYGAWYFDPHVGRCKEVTAGVCGTGRNLFLKKEACQKFCEPRVGTRDSLCKTPPTIGSCRPIFRAWYFDHHSSVCKMFNYTICGGGANRFVSEMKCQERCRPQHDTKPFCSQRPIATRCWGRNGRWYFHDQRNTCLTFLNGRCGSNKNSFSTVTRCIERCSYVKS